MLVLSPFLLNTALGQCLWHGIIFLELWSLKYFAVSAGHFGCVTHGWLQSKNFGLWFWGFVWGFVKGEKQPNDSVLPFIAEN